MFTKMLPCTIVLYVHNTVTMYHSFIFFTIPSVTKYPQCQMLPCTIVLSVQNTKRFPCTIVLYVHNMQHATMYHSLYIFILFHFTHSFDCSTRMYTLVENVHGHRKTVKQGREINAQTIYTYKTSLQSLSSHNQPSQKVSNGPCHCKTE